MVLAASGYGWLGQEAGSIWILLVMERAARLSEKQSSWNFLLVEMGSRIVRARKLSSISSWLDWSTRARSRAKVTSNISGSRAIVP